MKAKWSIFFVLVLAMSMFLAACGGGSSEESSSNNESSEESSNSSSDSSSEDTKDEPKKEEPQVLNLLGGSEIPSMDTTQATDSVSFLVMNNVFEGLYRLGPDNTPVPGVAKDYEVSNGGLTYTFTLREDAKWSNGTPVTAHDFVFSWRKALHPDTLSPYAYIMGDVKNANAVQDEENELYGKVEELGVKALDDHTLEVQLENAIPYFVGLSSFATFYPQNEEFVTSQGENYGLEVENLIFNGPFVLNSWEHEEGWQYTKNPEYWDKETVKLDEINVKVIKDVATGVNLYETGKVDRAGLSAEYVDQYKDHPHFGTVQEPVLFFLRFNQESDALANKNIRIALDYGWNKEGLTDVILNNGSIPAYFLVPQDFVFGPDGEDFRAANGNFRDGSPEERAAKAKEYWEKGLAELGTDTVELELLNYDSESSKKIGEYLKNQLEGNLPGFKMSIKQQPFKQKLALEDEGNYDISFSGWGPDYQDPMTFVDMFVTGGAHNQMAYSNPEFDRLVDESKTDLSDLAARWDKLQEAEKIFMEDAGFSPMYQRGGARLAQPYVKDYIIHPFGADASFKWAYIEGKE